MYNVLKLKRSNGLLNHRHVIKGRSGNSGAREGHAANHRIHGGERRRAAAAAAGPDPGLAAGRSTGYVAERPAAELRPQLRGAGRPADTVLPLRGPQQLRAQLRSAGRPAAELRAQLRGSGRPAAAVSPLSAPPGQSAARLFVTVLLADRVYVVRIGTRRGLRGGDLSFADGW